MAAPGGAVQESVGFSATPVALNAGADNVGATVGAPIVVVKLNGGQLVGVTASP
jgi:hypothetical protein